MGKLDQYKISEEPFYQSQADEIEMYKAAYTNRMPVMLKGPTGCGKSRFVEYMAYTLGKPLITVACNEDMSASDLVGRFLLDKEGTVWKDGPLAMAARYGGICYLDEVVEAGLGIGFVSKHSVSLQLKNNIIKQLNVAPFPIIRQWHIVHHAEAELSPIARRFKKFVIENT